MVHVLSSHFLILPLSFSVFHCLTICTLFVKLSTESNYNPVTCHHYILPFLSCSFSPPLPLLSSPPPPPPLHAHTGGVYITGKTKTRQCKSNRFCSHMANHCYHRASPICKLMAVLSLTFIIFSNRARRLGFFFLTLTKTQQEKCYAK